MAPTYAVPGLLTFIQRLALLTRDVPECVFEFRPEPELDFQFRPEPDRNFDDCAILHLRSLKKVAEKFLTSPLSSVYSERLFSEFGNIYEEKRSRLLPETGEKLLFHHNLKLF